MARLADRNSTTRNREKIQHTATGLNLTQQHLNLSSELASILDAATKMQGITKPNPSTQTLTQSNGAGSRQVGLANGGKNWFSNT
jgi:hypothetical protein